MRAPPHCWCRLQISTVPTPELRRRLYTLALPAPCGSAFTREVCQVSGMRQAASTSTSNVRAFETDACSIASRPCR